MTYDNNGIEAEYVVPDANPAYVQLIAETVERSWLSRNWWLPLLAALALATLLIWLANRNQTCTLQGSALTISTDQEQTIIDHLTGVVPGITDANRTEALTAARNVCAARLAGNSGDTLNTHINNAFNFVGGEGLAGTALTDISEWVAGETWCHC